MRVFVKFNFNSLIIKQKHNNYHILVFPVNLLLGTLYFLKEVYDVSLRKRSTVSGHLLKLEAEGHLGLGTQPQEQ